jgi:hypothetical protein
MTGVRHVLELLDALYRQESASEEDAPGTPVISSATMLEALIDNDFDLSSAIVSIYHDA